MLARERRGRDGSASQANDGDSIMDNRAMATKKPKGLGLGLEALLGPTVRDPSPDANLSDSKSPRRTRCALDELQPGKYQPRTRMDEGALYELAESIKAQGVMQPVLVRRVNGGGAPGDECGPAPRYEVIAGERRVRAAKLAGLDRSAGLVRDVPDEAAAAMSLIENIQREDLNPLEEAQGLKRLTDEFGLTHEEAAQVGGSIAQRREQSAALVESGRAGAADAAGRRPRHGPRAGVAAARRRRADPRARTKSSRRS